MDKPANIRSVLSLIVKKLGLRNCSFEMNMNPDDLKGFMGDIYKVAIVKEDNLKLHLVIKTAPANETKRKYSFVPEAYANEAYFYEVILPAFEKIQAENNLHCIVLAPRYFANISEAGYEMLALENIKLLGFLTREQDFVMDSEHAAAVFKTFGRFHGLSYALKENDPEGFENLVRPVVDFYSLWLTKGGLLNLITKLANKCIGALNIEDNKSLGNDLNKYLDKAGDIFLKCYQCVENEKYSVITHGDCWTNNMMFKYENSSNYTKLEDINLVDFQLIRVGSPVHDLAYVFFVGGSKKLYENLSGFLDVYYESFSSCVKQLRCCPEKLMPRSALNEHWRRYAKFGMLMSLIHTKAKLMTMNDLVGTSEDFGSEKGGEKFANAPCNETVYYERVRNMFVHLYENNAL